MPSMQFTETVSGGGLSQTQITTVTGDNINVYEVSIPNSADNLVTIAIDHDLIQGYWIHAAADMTLETNSSSSPTNTIALKANQPLFWRLHTVGQTYEYYTGLITADVVTDMYFTNASGAAADVKIIVVQDSTP